MSFNPSARSEKTLLLSAPQDRTYRSTRNRVDRREKSHGLHYGRYTVSVVRRAGGGVPGIEVGADEDNLLPDDGIGAWNLGENVVAVDAILVVLRVDTNAQLDGSS